MPPTTTDNLDAIVTRATDIYSLPAVVVEVLDLIDQPTLDAAALKQCIERDPALVAKVLRVVNSSVFGMSRRVENLKQAIALLGFRPLKLLVLGFSLPPQLAKSLSRDVLSAHWRTGLTRAVAARVLARDHFLLEPDDAFIAALLADIGRLVLLGQLGETYAELLQRADELQLDRADETRKALGFDQYELTAALLSRWRLPPKIVACVSALAGKNDEVACHGTREPVARAVLLADLVADVVEGHRLAALPQLLALAERWARLDKQGIKKLIATVDKERQQLADVFQVDLPSSEDGQSLLVDAYENLSHEVEWAITEPDPNDAQRLSGLQQLRSRLSILGQQLHLGDSTPVATSAAPANVAPGCDKPNDLARLVAQAVIRCRGEREPLSVMLVEAQPAGGHASVDQLAAMLAMLVNDQLEGGSAQIAQSGPCGVVTIIPGLDRHDARDAASRMVADCEEKHAPADHDAPFEKLSIGVAGVETIARSFDPRQLVTGAERCLAAARDCERSAVKSIEVY